MEWQASRKRVADYRNVFQERPDAMGNVQQPGSNPPQWPLNTRPYLRRDIAWWIVAIVAFMIAMVSAFARDAYDLRTPAILGVNVVVGTLYMLITLAIQERLTTRTRWLCLAYGLWAASVFRVVLPFFGDMALFSRNDVAMAGPGMLLAVLIHGAVTVFCAFALVRHIFSEEFLGAMEAQSFQVAIGTVVVFYIIAAVVRLTSALN